MTFFEAEDTAGRFGEIIGSAIAIAVIAVLTLVTLHTVIR